MFMDHTLLCSLRFLIFKTALEDLLIVRGRLYFGKNGTMLYLSANLNLSKYYTRYVLLFKNMNSSDARPSKSIFSKMLKLSFYNNFQIVFIKLQS